MRTRFIVLMAMLLGAAGIATAQQSILPSRPLGTGNGTFNVGFRITSAEDDEARFQRFRDVRDGAFLEGFRLARENDTWLFEAGADHVGYRDQRYWAEYAQIGKVKASFTWDQVPLFYSADSQTLYREASPGVLRIDDDIQRGIENRQLTLASVMGRATSFEGRSRRDTAKFALEYLHTRQLGVNLNVVTTMREGTMPFAASFGFSNAVEVALPLDNRTTDVGAGLEWANGRGMFRAGYAGSWFNNDIPVLTWDNPIKFTDATYASAYSPGDGTSQGRMALAPNNTLHTVNVGGSIKLPGHSRANAFVTVGFWNQNEALLPHTINTAIQTIPLERQTAEAEAQTLAMNYSLTTRPNRYVWLNARYRFNQFDNQSVPFETEEYVRFDQVLEEGPWESEPYGYTSHNFDVDASFTPVGFTAFKVGYGRGVTDRTFRIFERTTEDVFRAAVDTTGNPWVTLRAIYEFSSRDGSGFEAHLLDEVGEQPAMRHYDVANRDRNRVTALVQVTPVSALGFTASVAAGKDDYKDSGFGLRDNDHRVYTVGFDVIPNDQASFGVSYGYEKYTALQWSRSANPGAQFVDPTRDWSIDSDDKVHTVSTSLDLVKAIPKTELRFAYDYNRSNATYVYGVVPDSTLFPGGFPDARQLPPVTNELQTGTADVLYFLTDRLGIGLTYWHDRYRVDDFALGTQTIDQLTLPGGLLLGYLYRPYTANSVWVRMTYLW